MSWHHRIVIRQRIQDFFDALPQNRCISPGQVGPSNAALEQDISSNDPLRMSIYEDNMSWCMSRRETDLEFQVSKLQLFSILETLLQRFGQGIHRNAIQFGRSRCHGIGIPVQIMQPRPQAEALLHAATTQHMVEVGMGQKNRHRSQPLLFQNRIQPAPLGSIGKTWIEHNRTSLPIWQNHGVFRKSVARQYNHGPQVPHSLRFNLQGSYIPESMTVTTRCWKLGAWVLAWMLLHPGGAMGQFHDGLNMTFGKQRVQYRSFDWQYLPGDPFEVYHYQGGRSLAEFAMNALTLELPRVESTFQLRVTGPVEVIVFNKHADFRQSNIGIDGTEAGNIGGTTLIHGKKLFAWFDGDHARFQTQLREGLYRILLRQYLFGDDWKDVVKNNQLFQLPEWMEEGMVTSLASPQITASSAELQDLVYRGLIPQLQVLEGESLRLASAAVWRFILDTFGRQAALDVLSGFKSGRTPDAGFRRIGMDMEGLLAAAQAHYALGTVSEKREERGVALEWAQVNHPRAQMGKLPHRARRKYRHHQFSTSADGRWTAWATDERGQVKVWWTDGRRKKCLAKYDHKLTRIVDGTYPVLAWHPKLPVLAHIHEEKGRVFLTLSDASSGDSNEQELFRIEKVIDLDWSPDGRKIAFSGVNAGRSDLYVYNTLAGSQVPLWEDGWDDHHPNWSSDGRGIWFSSNRPGNEEEGNPNVPQPGGKDIWYYDLDAESFERVTDTPDRDEVHPVALDAGSFAYQLAHDPDVVHLATRDSAILRVDTAIHYRYFTRQAPWFHLEGPTLELDLLPNGKGWEGVLLQEGRPRWQSGSLPDRPLRAAMREWGTDPIMGEEKPWDYLPAETVELLPGQVDYRNYIFESERRRALDDLVLDGASPVSNVEMAATLPPVPTPLPHRRNYAVDQLLSQVDNSFATSFYQPFTGAAGSFPGLSSLIKIGVSDLFEDNKWIGGVRLAGSLQNSTFVLANRNLERKVDREWVFERMGNEGVDSELGALTRTHTHAVHYRRTLPFSETMSLRAQLTYRMDRVSLLATDPFNAGRDDLYVQGVGGTVSWVFDDSRELSLNIHNGTRAKAWFEMLAPPDGDGDILLVAGFDARRYIPLYRRFTLCLRAAGNTSFGERGLIHYLGGVQESLLTAVDGAMPIPDGNFLYQTSATPMRGFVRNARNGTSFAVANAELRLPVFATLSPKKSMTPFLEHFQAVGFFDIGSAWTGEDPYSDENAFNSSEVDLYPVSVTVANNREPIIWDFGFGLRSQLLGYFVRADWGWGVDDGILLDRVFQLSLSTDF